MTGTIGIGRPEAGSSHADRIAFLIEGENLGNDLEEVSFSWRQCVVEHRLEPNNSSAPNILTEREIAELRDPFDAVLLAPL